MNLIRKNIRYFTTYEQREDAFIKDVGSLIPSRYQGPRFFWEDFRRIWQKNPELLSKSNIAFVPSNPRDCLAFGTPWQVLQAARLSNDSADKKKGKSTDAIAEQFGIHQNLHQPIRTLSGGETVKLALAKMSLSIPANDKIVIASPFSWLSQDNMVCLEQLLTTCREQKVYTKLLSLKGEDDIEPIRNSRILEMVTDESIRFSLSFKNVSIQLGACLPSFNARQTVALVENQFTGLLSPCLFMGQNGQGKSLVAKALSGAIPLQGRIRIETGNSTAPARLLFQDIMTQTLSRPFENLASCFSVKNDITASTLFNRIYKEYLFTIERAGETRPDTFPSDNRAPHSLLDTKIMLVAIRLFSSPGILILDEPDWGLSKTAAIAFVMTVIKISHSMNIPVILISHKPWWKPIANSVIHIQKSEFEIDEGVIVSFTIEMREMRKGGESCV